MTERSETVGKKFGRLAYCAGHRSDANPFVKGSQLYRDWREGWTEMALFDATTCGADGVSANAKEE